MCNDWSRKSIIIQWEKSCGKHPAQKPLGVLVRLIQAGTKVGAWIRNRGWLSCNGSKYVIYEKSYWVIDGVNYFHFHPLPSKYFSLTRHRFRSVLLGTGA